jgi:hypothetical protein
LRMDWAHYRFWSFGCFLARDNVGLLSDILKLLVVFAGGFGSGFGLKTYLEKKK